MQIGSEAYAEVAHQVKEFLRFNGYTETLSAIEKEEAKVVATTQGERDGLVANQSTKQTLDVSCLSASKYLNVLTF